MFASKFVIKLLIHEINRKTNSAHKLISLYSIACYHFVHTKIQHFSHDCSQGA